MSELAKSMLDAGLESGRAELIVCLGSFAEYAEVGSRVPKYKQMKIGDTVFAGFCNERLCRCEPPAPGERDLDLKCEHCEGVFLSCVEACSAEGGHAKGCDYHRDSKSWAIVLADNDDTCLLDGCNWIVEMFGKCGSCGYDLSPPETGLWFWEGGTRTIDSDDIEFFGTWTKASVTNLINGEEPAAAEDNKEQGCK